LIGLQDTTSKVVELNGLPNDQEFGDGLTYNSVDQYLYYTQSTGSATYSTHYSTIVKVSGTDLTKLEGSTAS